jgi:hypothetical protein
MAHPYWNKDNMFFLTRDGDIEITEYDKLFYYGNQCLADGSRVKEEPDVFGRNYTDKLFIQLCIIVHIHLVYAPNTFQSLSCKKVGERYEVRLELLGDQFTGDETLEMELSEMVALFEERCRADT